MIHDGASNNTTGGMESSYGLDEGDLEFVTANSYIFTTPKTIQKSVGMQDTQNVQQTHARQQVPMMQQIISKPEAFCMQQTQDYATYSGSIVTTLQQAMEGSFSYAYPEDSTIASQATDVHVDEVIASETGVIKERHEADEDVLVATNDTFPDLDQINSSDLMKFSQQSVINRIADEQLYSQDICDVAPVTNPDTKQTLNVLPTFEEHDIGGYKFQVKLPNKTQRKGKSNWIFSEVLNKIYIRMNEGFTLDAIITPKIPKTPLRLRMLLCFVKEVGEPVLRCQNHTSKDNELDPNKRVSLLRCENPDTEYCGSDTGLSIVDRYSVVVPLNTCIPPGQDNTIKQTIALKFACQNSCIGRRETKLIFLLESTNGEILSQRMLDVKICSCPKRDRSIDERNHPSGKRKIYDDSYPRERKVARQCSSSPSLVKEELSSSDQDDDSNDGNSRRRCDFIPNTTGGCRLIVDLDSVQTAVRMMESACESLALSMALHPNNESTNREFKRMHRVLQKLRKS